MERHLARLQREDAERAEHAHLPTEDDLEELEARAVVERFFAIRDNQKGSRVASVALLADPAGAIATALFVVAEVEGDPRRFEEAFVDLQSFRPDDDVALITDPSSPPKERDRAAARLRGARAAATAFLRDDITIVGNELAMDTSLAIGDGRRALDAVERYRTVQAASFMSIYLWPIGAIAGGVIGIFVARLSLVGLAGAAILAIATLVVAPFYSWGVGTAVAAVNNASMRLPGARLAGITHLVTDALSLFLLVAGPAVSSLVIAIMAKSLGLP